MIPVGSIVIHDGRISDVGATVVIPSGADVFDAKGLTVYPGFLDAYCTSGLKLPDAPSTGTPPDSRTTAPASMWHANRKGIRLDVVAAKCLDVKSRVKDVLAQGITTALLAPGSGSVRGVAAIIDYTDAGMVLAPSAGEDLSFRGGGGGGGGGAYPGTLFGTTALLRQVLYDARDYANAPPATKDSGFEAIKPLFAGQMPALLVADTSREISRSSRLTNEFGFETILVGGREAYRNLSLVKTKFKGVIVSTDLGFEPDRKAQTGPDAVPQEVLDERHLQWEERTLNVKKLLEAHIPVAFSTLGMIGSDNYLKNVRKLIATGVARDEALKALTSGAANLLSISDQVGTIAKGKRADFVVMNGDFADDKTQIQAVFVEGKRTDEKAEAKK